MLLASRDLSIGEFTKDDTRNDWEKFFATSGSFFLKSSAEMISPILEQRTGYRPKMKNEISRLGRRCAKKYCVAKSASLSVYKRIVI